MKLIIKLTKKKLAKTEPKERKTPTKMLAKSKKLEIIQQKLKKKPAKTKKTKKPIMAANKKKQQ